MVDGRQPPPNRPRPAQMLGLSFLTLVGAMGTSRAFVPSPTARMPASSTGLRSSVAENDALEADTKAAASSSKNDYAAHKKFWEVEPTQMLSSRSMPPGLLEALQTNTHPRGIPVRPGPRDLRHFGLAQGMAHLRVPPGRSRPDRPPHGRG